MASQALTESLHGVVPNGNHVAIPIITICVVVTAIFYALRFYSKALAKNINLADYLTIVSFPLFWVYVYFSYRLSWTSGYLVHQADMPLEDIAAFSYVCFVATLLYLWVIALVKVSILHEWTCIFVPSGSRTLFTWACYATSFAFSSLSLILFIMDLVNCTPFEGNWDPFVGGRECRFAIPQFGLASSTANLVLDLVPIILAQRAIWGLNMSLEKKMGVSTVFFIGIIGIVATAVRVYFATRFYTSNDTSYFFSIMALCSLCETTCAHLVLCMPMVPKAMMGLAQIKLYRTIKEYLTLRSKSTCAGESSGLHEVRQGYRIRSLKNEWHNISESGSIRAKRSNDSDQTLQ